MIAFDPLVAAPPCVMHRDQRCLPACEYGLAGRCARSTVDRQRYEEALARLELRIIGLEAALDGLRAERDAIRELLEEN